MSPLLAELPEDLRREVAARTDGDPDRGAEWVAAAVRERLAALAAVEQLQQRAARGNRAAFDRVLARVPDVPPLPGDER